MAHAVVLTYHAVAEARSPLCIDPALFAAHLDLIADSHAARPVTIRALADELAEGTLSDTLVAITFDDGFASVAETAAPALLERGLTSTVFCVAGHLGQTNDWRSARSGGYRAPLMGTETLTELRDAGFEIGSHGLHHDPLANAPENVHRAELVDARAQLEDAVGAEVTSFAYPYGALPSRSGRRLTAETYDAACTTSLGLVSSRSPRHAIPRIDAHYVRRPELLERVLESGLGVRLRGRALAARTRRIFIRDYSPRRARHPAAA